jgi:Tol biopolymer transport system component
LLKELLRLVRPAPVSRIVFERTGETIPGLPRGIFTISPDGTDCRQLWSKGDSPKWSPDGRWISFIESTKDNGWLHSVFVMKANGQSPRRLTFHHDVAATAGSWSPDSSRLVYSLWLWQEKKNELCIVDVASGNWKHVLYSDDDMYPIWAPTNKIIFRQVNASGGLQLFEVNPDGTGFQPCPIFEEGDDEPTWTLDGSKVVFIGNEGLTVMNGDGSNRMVVRSAPEPVQCAISPDGLSVAYSSQETRGSGFEIFTINLNDEVKRRLVANPMKGDKEIDSRGLSWSPWL